MYCPKCGSEIPENSRFCVNCGAAVGKETPAPAPKDQGKKRTPIWVTLIVVAAAFLIGKFVLAPAMLSEPEPSQSAYRQEETKKSSHSDYQREETKGSSSNDDAPSTAYSEIFSGRHIIDTPTIFFMMDSSAFAAVDGEGVVEKLEFGYKDDMIKQMVDTVYYPISDMDDEQKSAMDAAVREGFAAYEAVDFCKVSYSMDNFNYKVVIHFTDLDSSENVQKMIEFGLVSGEEADGFSMEKTEDDLLAAGYVKR